MKPKKIVYIGNNLSSEGKNVTTINILSNYLITEGFIVSVASNKTNKIFRMIDMILHTIKNRKADYILIDTYSTVNFYYAFIISQIARFLKIKYIPILHGGNLPKRIENSKSFSNKIFKNSYVNVAPSNFLKKEFKKKNYNTIHIPNIIDIKKYTFLKREIVFPKLLWVRSFNEIYNPMMAIKVLENLKKKFPQIKLCMIGPNQNEYFEGVLDYVKKQELLDSIEFTGLIPKEDWHKKSKDYNIFINTSNLDNTPVSVIEVMALGLPIVSTNVGGMPYLISNNTDGRLVDVNDVKGMSDEIINLVNNPLQVNELIHNARKKATSFDWEEVKNSWIKLLK